MSSRITTRRHVISYTAGRIAIAVAITVVTVSALELVAFGTDLEAMVPVGTIVKSGAIIGTIVATFLAGALTYRASLLMMHLNVARAELLRLSHTDPLTGLLNRRGFDEAAGKALSKARLQQLPVAAMMCDIDYFKAINDRFGHDFGDTVLIQIADVLRHFGRDNHVLLARHGGEEFTALMIGVSEDQAINLAETLRHACATKVMHNEDYPVGITVSIGLAASQGDVSVSAIMSAADRALFTAKKSGRNQVARAGLRHDLIAA